KGLEWDAVLLPGLVEGIMPIVHARTAEGIEEERRLLYVAVTRSRKHLALSWAPARAPGAAQARQRSRFLAGLTPASAPAGAPGVPLVYTVDRVRDGRSFSTRRVTAIQHGKAIFAMSASFHRPEPGVEHASPMPQAPPPEDLRRSADRLEEALGVPLPARFADSPIDLRAV